MPTLTTRGEVLLDGVKAGRGALADEATKQKWREAYRLFSTAPGYGPPHPRMSRFERTDRINYVMSMLGLTRKQAKRRIKNYEQAKRLGRV